MLGLEDHPEFVAACRRWDEQGMVKRLWEGDPTIWGDRSTPELSNRLGWLRLYETTRLADIDKITAPLLDTGLSSLLTDLHERGLDKEVSVVVWGEFGRTPRLNNKNSRDHWPQANCALLAGGGMKTGQVIGATNRYAEHPVERPIQFQEIFATLYAKAGLNLNTREFDLRGRPQYLIDPGIEPIRELM